MVPRYAWGDNYCMLLSSPHTAGDSVAVHAAVLMGYYVVLHYTIYTLYTG